MAEKGVQMSRLFGSLRADDAEFQQSAATAAGEAEKRWPLFKAVAVSRLAPPPPLTAQARQQRLATDPVAASPRKSGLVVPSLGGKLADSLSRLVPTPKRAARNSPKASAQEAFMSAPDPAAVGGAGRLVATRVQSRTVEPDPAPAKPAEPSRKSGSLFGRKAKPAPTMQGAADQELPDGPVSLARIFSRLEEAQAPEQETLSSRSSIFGKRPRR